MTQSLEQILESLEQYWKTIDYPLLSKLGPGIDPDIIEPRNFDGILPGDLKVLYKWRNGIKPEFLTDFIGQLTLFDGAIPMAMERVSQVQDRMGGDEEMGWDRLKLPIFESGGGEYYLINCDASISEFGEIIFHSIGAVDHEKMISVYDSLVTLFQSILKAYEEKLFRVGDNGFLEVSDYKKLNRVKKDLNPGSEYWKLYNW